MESSHEFPIHFLKSYSLHRSFASVCCWRSSLSTLQRFEKADDILLATGDGRGQHTRTGHLIRQRHEAIGDRQGFALVAFDGLQEGQGLTVMHQTVARADAPERRCAHLIAR